MKKILVTNDNLADVTEHLYAQDQLGLDTETYGVRYEDNMFALQIASGEHAFYFNMHNYEYDTQGEIYVWETHELMAALKPLFNKKSVTWFIHNAKFDLHSLLMLVPLLAVEYIVLKWWREYCIISTSVIPWMLALGVERSQRMTELLSILESTSATPIMRSRERSVR